MTREEAIAFFKDMNECTYGNLEAVEMAIKALEQEPFKPMVEIDLYSVIKQSYIEREVLDKIRAEIEQTYETDIGFLIHDETKRTILNIIDKYRAESEPQESEDEE